MYIISCFLWSLIHLLITYPLYHQFWSTIPMFVGESSMSPNEVPLIYHSWLYIPYIYIYISHSTGVTAGPKIISPLCWFQVASHYFPAIFPITARLFRHCGFHISVVSWFFYYDLLVKPPFSSHTGEKMPYDLPRISPLKPPYDIHIYPQYPGHKSVTRSQSQDRSPSEGAASWVSVPECKRQKRPFVFAIMLFSL